MLFLPLLLPVVMFISFGVNVFYRSQLGNRLRDRPVPVDNQVRSLQVNPPVALLPTHRTTE